MLEIPGFTGTKKILWQNISSGMIIIDGIKINGAAPYELQNFTVLTFELISNLTNKYKLLANKEVIVAYSEKGASVFKMAESMRKMEKKIISLNELRSNFSQERKKLSANFALDPFLPILESRAIEKSYLIKDTYNSFQTKLTTSPVPSLFSRMEESIQLSGLLSGNLKQKFNLPEDVEVLLHLVVDYSYSMNTMQKLDLVIATVHNIYKFFSEMMLNLKINLYVFSDEAALVKFPLSGREIERKNTNYASFMKKILHHKNKDVHNKIILFTDGEPSDQSEALLNADRLRKQKIDYTQIIFNINEDRRHKIPAGHSNKNVIDGYAVDSDQSNSVFLSDAEWSAEKETIFRKFTDIAEACGGNQIILDIYELLNLVSLEVYDRYLGLLSLASSPQEIQIVKNETLREAQNYKKEVKPFVFKKL